MGARLGCVAFAWAVLFAGCTGGKQESAPKLDPDHLPVLPRELLAVERAGGVVLDRIDGSEIGRLDRYGIFDGSLVVDGREVEVSRRLRRIVPSSTRTKLSVSVSTDGDPCGDSRSIGTLRERTIISCSNGTLALEREDGDVAPLARTASGLKDGSWNLALASPKRKRLLLEWASLRCEAPFAYTFTIGGSPPAAVARHTPSYAVGWTQAGRALVRIPAVRCGNPAHTPGVYAVTPSGLILLARGTDALLLSL